MGYETLLYEKEDGVGIITLNRPKSLNAMSFQLKEEVSAILDEIEKDDDVKVVIITGGPKAFSAGADIKERSGAQRTQPQFYFSQRKTHYDFYGKIENFEKPIIAAVSGVAVGGGCEISLACDLRIASETARFGVPEVKLGAIPSETTPGRGVTGGKLGSPKPYVWTARPHYPRAYGRWGPAGTQRRRVADTSGCRPCLRFPYCVVVAFNAGPRYGHQQRRGCLYSITTRRKPMSPWALIVLFAGSVATAGATPS